MASAHRHREACGDRGHPGRIRAALAITLTFFVVELVGGWFSGSLALLSDAGHMLADVFALLLTLFAWRFSRHKATAEKSYGWYRLEILSALANGVVLSLVALFVLREAWSRLLVPQPVATGMLLAVAAAGLVANVAAAALLHKGKGNINVRGAYLHVLADTLSSAAVLVGGIMMRVTGQMRIDAAIGAVIACVILWSAVRLVREAVDVLLEGIPKGMAAIDVSAEIARVPGVVAVHDLHIWSLTTGFEALSAHVLVRREDLPETDRILGAINASLADRFGISHTTLQVESDATAHVCAVVNE